ncbi:hypothetical protein [Candidatus Magnetominusculus xianensis]|uniref:Uncharacterized protein n=1 Tax=Candidatus Magnetominusculus xianensis TaxID=1748249 RepID=A0ABR5SC56_9BACT|nr:hypothetical protein [Candidatus Magnetominusculus xianensis]KWT79146.1 hypothetical protein ASN18_2767 [Candidatus Magnetominusculus xianensis]MBF0405577.1 hypothetical protein [Nitrospirota bacterium]
MAVTTAFRIYDENEYQGFEGTVPDGGVIKVIKSIRNNGVSPEKVFMDLWSKHTDTIWPEAEVLIYYDRLDESLL